VNSNHRAARTVFGLLLICRLIFFAPHFRPINFMADRAAL
jgi:hypothetical protein